MWHSISHLQLHSCIIQLLRGKGWEQKQTNFLNSTDLIYYAPNSENCKDSLKKKKKKKKLTADILKADPNTQKVRNKMIPYRQTAIPRLFFFTKRDVVYLFFIHTH